MQALLGEPARWSTDNYLTAQLIDAINLLRVQVVGVQPGVKRPPKFEAYPRPGEDPDKGKLVIGRGNGVSVEEMRRTLDRARRGAVNDG